MSRRAEEAAAGVLSPVPLINCSPSQSRCEERGEQETEMEAAGSGDGEGGSAGNAVTMKSCHRCFRAAPGWGSASLPLGAGAGGKGRRVSRPAGAFPRTREPLRRSGAGRKQKWEPPKLSR